MNNKQRNILSHRQNEFARTYVLKKTELIRTEVKASIGSNYIINNVPYILTTESKPHLRLPIEAVPLTTRRFRVKQKKTEKKNRLTIACKQLFGILSFFMVVNNLD